MAPELHTKRPYQGDSVDVFAVGVLLFTMFTGRPPFQEARQFDKFYRCIMLNRPNVFWKSQPEGADFFPKGFKSLFEGMVSQVPAKRPTIPKILSNPWLTDGETPS